MTRYPDEMEKGDQDRVPRVGLADGGRRIRQDAPRDW
jgi:hypothetical protein